MKKVLLGLTAMTLFAFAACKKNSSSTTYDNHSSPLMKVMHSMDSSMQAMTMTHDPDHDFAMMMKEHHMGAINMANYELANGTDATIKGMAQTMKDAQTREVAMLDSFMMAHAPSNMNMAMMDSFDAAMMRMTKQADAQTLKGQSDHDFSHLMIVHHQSAIDMANSEMMYGQVSFMKDMANMMKADQTKEIGELQAWLNSSKD